MNSDAANLESVASERSWTAPLDVTPTQPRRGRSRCGRLIEAAIVLLIVAAFGVFFAGRLFPIAATHYRCAVCGAMATERAFLGDRTFGEPYATEESRLFDSLSTCPHEHRWSKGQDTFWRNSVTGKGFMAASRDCSPTWGLYEEEYRRLLEKRLARDGDLRALESELNAIEDVFEQEGSYAAKTLMIPLWEDMQPEQSSASTAEQPSELAPLKPLAEEPSPAEKPLPEAI